MHSRTPSLGDWVLVDQNVTEHQATLPPELSFDGEIGIFHATAVGEAQSRTPVGEIYITSAAVYYISAWFSSSDEQIVISHGSIDYISIEKNANQKIELFENEVATFSCVVELFCKHLQTLRFCFSSFSDAQNFHNLAKQYCCYRECGSYFAFHNQSYLQDAGPGNYTGWNLYSIDREYYRMNVNSQIFRISNINSDFSVCNSYPPRVIVPTSITDNDIIEMSEFRKSGRFISMTFYSSKYGTSISRSSQPKVGFLRGKNIADIKTLEAYQVLNSIPVTIVDCRSRLNAFANLALGGGTEDSSCYQEYQLSYGDIENIHAMRESLHNVQRKQSSGWLDAIDSIMKVSASVVNQIINDKSVLIHCSDGWDRTPQVSAMAQIMIDPFYRTIVGFETLIEKEWLSFGHKFTERCGHDAFGDFWKGERSPIFLQFLDCTYQLLVVHPTKFQFNEHFLIDIMDNVYSCYFGTFLYNNCSERADHNIRQLTPSLWSYLNSPQQWANYVNHKYSPSDHLLHVHCFNTLPTLWKGYFNRNATRKRKQSWKVALVSPTPLKKVPLSPKHITNFAGKVSKLIPAPPKSPSPTVFVRHSSILSSSNENPLWEACIEDYLPE